MTKNLFNIVISDDEGIIVREKKKRLCDVDKIFKKVRLKFK